MLMNVVVHVFRGKKLQARS